MAADTAVNVLMEEAPPTTAELRCAEQSAGASSRRSDSRCCFKQGFLIERGAFLQGVGEPCLT